MSICAFCLSGETDLPPLASPADAALLHPCPTCLLVAHKTCLTEWFNSLPPSKLKPVSGLNSDPLPNTETYPDPELDGLNINSPFGSVLVLWGLDASYRQALPEMSMAAACPQCKSNIVFQMNQLWLFLATSLVRQSIRDMATYSGLFLGISGAATGVVTLGYVGLARCGLNMLDAMIPQKVLMPLFGRRNGSGGGGPGVNQANLRLSPPISGTDQLDSALSLMNHLKFQLVPLLPVMLWRSRQCSILDCFSTKSPLQSLTNAVSEFLVCNYILSISNHRLVRAVYANIKAAVFLQKMPGITWSDPAIMIGSLIPARWLYDVIFRLTFNRAHFNLAEAASPRNIANSLSEQQMAALETLERRKEALDMRLRATKRVCTKSGGVRDHFWGQLRWLKTLISEGLLLKSAYVRARLWCLKLAACLKNDYSSLFLPHSATVQSVTTVLWPFVAADLGKLVLQWVLRKIPLFKPLPSDKLLLLANLAGLFAVALAKDTFSVYISSKKARRLYDIKILTARAVPTVPGAF